MTFRLRVASAFVALSVATAPLAAAQDSNQTPPPQGQQPAPNTGGQPAPPPAQPEQPAPAQPDQPAPAAPAPGQTPETNGSPSKEALAGVQPPPGYVIGPNDVLSVVFWRDQDMSAEVSVRPDGKISLPLINEVDAAGLTPDQLRDRVAQAASRYIADPTVSIVVKQINSRTVFITGEVNKPGAYPLMAPTTVMQLISLSGGLREFAKEKDIVILRNTENGQTAIPFNYKDVVNRKRLEQNILLQPGDTVVVP